MGHNNNMKYRTKNEIIASILQAANGGSTITNMTYKSFLSHDQLKRYVLTLEENGLLTHDKTDMTFRTTTKGLDFVAANNALRELCEPSGLAVSESP